MTYDKGCYELATSFLKDSDADPREIEILAHQLAQDIQRVIEDFLDARGIA